jgi:hypothetical protein
MYTPRTVSPLELWAMADEVRKARVLIWMNNMVEAGDNTVDSEFKRQDFQSPCPTYIHFG